jgi:hypothetical protein
MKKYLVLVDFWDRLYLRCIETDLCPKSEEFKTLIAKESYDLLSEQDHLEDVDWEDDNAPSLSFYEAIGNLSQISCDEQFYKIAQEDIAERWKEYEANNKRMIEAREKSEYERLKEKFEKEA